MSGDEDYGLQKMAFVWQENSKTVISLFLLFGTIGCISAIVLVHMYNYEKKILAQEQECADLGIVGAGLSGAYASWRLRNRGLRIRLFEATDRIGGRFYTRRLHDDDDDSATVTMEMGARFFVPSRHPLLNETIEKLGLLSIKAPTEDPLRRNYFVRGRHLNGARDLFGSKFPYKLNEEERNRTLLDLLRLALDKTLIFSVEDFRLDPMSAMTTEGHPLETISYWSVLKQLSDEALSFVEDSEPWRSSISGGNAALLASWHDASEDFDLAMTLADGMDRLPAKMVDDFLNASSGHSISLNRRLISVTQKTGFYQLDFSDSSADGDINSDELVSDSVCVRDVILAVPPPALRRIHFVNFRHLMSLNRILDRIVDIPAMVAYFVYNVTWFDDDDDVTDSQPCRDVITDLPLRHVRYVGSSAPRDGDVIERHVFMVVSVDDADADHFERAMMTSSPSKQTIDEKFVARVTRHLRAVCRLPHPPPPRPEQVFVQRWTAAGAASGGGRFAWRPGVRPRDAGDRLLSVAAEEGLFFVGDAFAPGVSQLWAEGALETVERALRIAKFGKSRD